MDVVTPALSLFAYSALMTELSSLDTVRLLLPSEGTDLATLGSDADRASRNQLQTRWLAQRFADWLARRAEVPRAVGVVPQAALVLRGAHGRPANTVK